MNQRSRLAVLFSCQAILSGGMALSFPFFAIYLHRERGIPMGVVGAALAMSILLTAVSHGLGGELSDILGRKRVMTLALASRAATVLLLAWAMWRGLGFLALWGIHAVSAFTGQFFDPAARGWVADHCSASERTRVYGLLRVAMNAGWAVGPALGGFLAQRSYPLMFCITAAAGGLCAALVAALIPEAPGDREKDEFEATAMLGAGRDRRFLKVCAYTMLIAAVMSQLVVSLSVHATQFVGVTEGQVGLLFSLNGLVVVLFQFPVTRWWSRRPISSALAFGSLLYAAGYAWVGFAAGMAGLCAGVFVVSIGETIVSPGIHALAANMAPAALKGRYIGFLGIATQVGHALGPLLGGLGLQYWSPRFTAGPWLGVGAVGVLAALGFRSIRTALTPREEGLVLEPILSGRPA